MSLRYEPFSPLPFFFFFFPFSKGLLLKIEKNFYCNCCYHLKGGKRANFGQFISSSVRVLNIKCLRSKYPCWNGRLLFCFLSCMWFWIVPIDVDSLFLFACFCFYIKWSILQQKSIFLFFHSSPNLLLLFFRL